MPEILGIWNIESNSVDPSFFRKGLKAGFRTLSDKMEERVREVLENQLPRAHLLGQVNLKGILESTKWGEQTSFYDFSSNVLAISVPFNMTDTFLSMSKQTADWMFVKMNSNKSDGSFWAISPTMRHSIDENLFDWIIRHEFGHSIDSLIQWTNRFSKLSIFGNWVQYNEAYPNDLILDLYMDLQKLTPQTLTVSDWLYLMGTDIYKELSKGLSTYD